MSEKEKFHSNSNKEDITDADSMHAKRVCKELEIKISVNTMICILKVWKLQKNVFKDLSAPWLAWQTALQKDWSKSRIIDWCYYAINGWKRN